MDLHDQDPVDLELALHLQQLGLETFGPASPAPVGRDDLADYQQAAGVYQDDTERARDDENAFHRPHRISQEEVEAPEHMYECVACREEYIAGCTIRAPCGHHLCTDCIRRQMEASLVSSTFRPLACCSQTIAIEEMPNLAVGFLGFLSEDLFDRYLEKKVERDTLHKTYCSNSKCSAFIPPAYITHRDAICPKCDTITCFFCKKSEHEGACLKDEALEKLHALAKREGMQFCQGCHELVERTEGCYHMTGEIRENTTNHLAGDIEKIREHLKIKEWHMILGGCWGTTLGLLYTQTYPERVKSLVLRGVSKMRVAELVHSLRGPNGAAKFYPEMYEQFIGILPAEEIKDPIAAYYKRLTSEDEEVVFSAAREWN
ncbi:putative Proline iminopeptidase [Seiridium cardinale]